MKEKTGNKIRLGIFVTAGLLLLITGIYVIGERQQMFNSTIRVSGIFEDVSGLQAGNNVLFSGITIGTIESIEIISDSSVRVDMEIEEDITKFIKKDAVAIIGTDGLMGNKVMLIKPGSDNQQPIENNDYLNTSVPVSMDDVLLNLEMTTENAALITYDLAEIIHNIRSGRGTIGMLFSDTTFAETFDETMTNLKEGTGGFKENMDAAGESILLRGAKRKKEREQERARKKAEKEKEEKEEEKK